MYYSHILFYPDIETIRRGAIVIVECEGLGMEKEAYKLNNAFFTQFLSQYPFLGKCRFFHTSPILNVLASMLRKILPKEVRDNFQFGCKFDGHLGEAFLVPTVEEAVTEPHPGIAAVFAIVVRPQRGQCGDMIGFGHILWLPHK